MNFINRTTGAVFFVDILGFGALTQNLINLKDEHYSPWLDKYHQNYDNQVLAAAILSEFREILISVDAKYNSVTISQLSDCAFIWSENITEVILAANNIMTECINNGIMCRGGMSYGEIIETKQNHNLGRFILGKAVTEAVKLEGIAKGCRIMISQEIPNALFHYDKDFHTRIHSLFQPFTNPLDYITYDEFKWYVVPDMDQNVADLKLIDTTKKLSLIASRLLLAVTIRQHPKYYLNSQSKEGLIQLRASINFIAKSNDEPFNFKHDFGWEDVVEMRSIDSLNRMTNLISSEKNSVLPFLIKE
ncbi:hypothetical protein ACLI09_05525 [Flavobacterium sp. RHBU_24]|uniref:hypothetical protein n=1 Tax=Flavobacterium sp. RHBU_24 TaxID=3391185 RepID=UPI00398498B9